ncbi:hypothetical protein BIY26_09430 [Brenneria goodwinii]|uniref:Uncharacterized protein n=1 Tax=Brenneria goodwinii TaxID=1109412 RepID=A0AAE8JN57_9GAMM|nr:hypothetical protein [Brenneria goodwinii]ATA23520.1 hypothetical protein AWC36_05050 [Brenneria goodwinii]RLM25229.1 hypothetical protein BIY26_09430 [Brenneria goodwinii]
MSDWTDDLICAHIDCDADKNIFDVLAYCETQELLDGWKLEHSPSNHIQWWLKKDNVEVGLIQNRNNIAMTANVLPIDYNEDAEKSNVIIRKLHDIFNKTNGILNSNL